MALWYNTEATSMDWGGRGQVSRGEWANHSSELTLPSQVVVDDSRVLSRRVHIVLGLTAVRLSMVVADVEAFSQSAE